jgi:2-polyprenyl-6-methoxyphenol hydroxylase-like FAD-dependent oxidoreductase
MKILVVGGGIGGLTVANLLARDGHTVQVVEQAGAFAPVGAGIVLAPNAVQCLRAVGVAASALGRELEAMDIVAGDGTLLQRLDTAAIARPSGGVWAMTRSSLHEALVRALPDGVDVRLGASVSAVQQDAESVAARLEGASGSEERYDVVVGADGLRSQVRRALYGPRPLRYSGVTCWRGLVSNPGFDRCIEGWGGEARVGVVPLLDGQLYYFLVLSAPPGADAPAWPRAFRARFAALEPVAGPLLDTLDALPPLHHDLEELQRPVWGQGRVLLLGDAAHAMTPNQGQGAAMAIEDAVVLTEVLRDGVPGALERYQARRHARVARVQLDSRRLGALAHWKHPAAQALRNGLLRRLPAALGARQYQRVVAPGLALMDEEKV